MGVCLDSEGVDRQRLRARNSEGGDVPEKYFVVTNNQLVRVKYLLVYSQKRQRTRWGPIPTPAVRFNTERLALVITRQI